MRVLNFKSSVILTFLISFLLLSSCGLALKEKPEEIEKMPIDKVYILAIDYYSNGLIDEAEFLYRKVIQKYESSSEKDESNKHIYLWSLYEVGFISYLKNDYQKAEEYFDKVILQSDSQSMPQVLLAKRVLLNIKKGR
ncbi:MAG: tetratricopeptide repeat protein [Brevinematia bacterium]